MNPYCRSNYHILMKKKEVNKFRCIILLTLFIGFFSSNLFFRHSHIVDGIIIVHSHPFKADSNGTPLHSHNNNSYILIHILNDFVVLPSLPAALAPLYILFFRKAETSEYRSIHPEKTYLLFKKRGPPSQLLCTAA